MTDHVLDALKIRRDDLSRKREARATQPGYGQNVADIDQAIAELDQAIQEREGTESPPDETT